MVPNPLGLLILLALLPAWVYLTRRRRHIPSGARTSVSELLELVAVAVVTTGATTLAAIIAADSNVRGTVSLTLWRRDGVGYLAEHATRVALNVTVVLAVASAAAYGLARIRYRGPAEHDADGDVWWKAFDDRPKGSIHYVGVMCDDGTLIEGQLVSFATETARTGEQRDVAIARPIRVTAPGRPPTMKDIDRVVIPERTIRYVTDVHTTPPPA